MRIVAGLYKGRSLESPANNAIRPTSDKVRGAMFNALLSRIDLAGAHVLDLFCGSGALGIEALSRGAGHCVFMDKSRQSLELAKSNIIQLNFSRETFETKLQDSVKLTQSPYPRKAQLAFLDPPYNKEIIPPTLDALHRGGWLADGALCVIESEDCPRCLENIANTPHFQINTSKRYGNTVVSYLAYRPNDAP